MTPTKRATDAERDGLIAHLVGDNNDEPMDWCDHCLKYVAEGDAKPYLDDKRYRACSDCRARMAGAEDDYIAAGFAQMSPLEQRYMDGDR